MILKCVLLASLLNSHASVPAENQRTDIEKDAVSGAMNSRFITMTSVHRGWSIVRGTAQGGGLVSFSWVNRSPRTAPPNESGLAERRWTFQFLERARQNIRLYIDDDTELTGRDSRDTMHTALYFFPRKQLPDFEIISSTGLRVWLPTGETFVVGRRGRVLGGVLEETGPMDRRPDRFTRDFAHIAYRGEGVMIRVDQRGAQPENGKPFGRHDANKSATATYRGRTCRLRPDELWTQRGLFDFKFPTDELLYSFLERRCRWQVRAGIGN